MQNQGAPVIYNPKKVNLLTVQIRSDKILQSLRKGAMSPVCIWVLR